MTLDGMLDCMGLSITFHFIRHFIHAGLLGAILTDGGC